MIGYKLAVVGVWSTSGATGKTHPPLTLGRVEATGATAVVVGGGGGGGRSTVCDIEWVLVLVLVVAVGAVVEVVVQICGIIPRRT